VKNYPEYPDNADAAIKDLAECCGEKDFRRAAAIVRLVKDLRDYAIQSRRLVIDALDEYFSEHRVRRWKGSRPRTPER
jgi:hypothetical protein